MRCMDPLSKHSPCCTISDVMPGPDWSSGWAPPVYRERVFTVSQDPALATSSLASTEFLNRSYLARALARFPALSLVPGLTTPAPDWPMSAHPLLTNNMSYVTLTTATYVMRLKNLTVPLSVPLW